jgi:SAM-dependent methyltransferase
VESVNFDRAADYYDATRALPGESMDTLVTMLAAELADRPPCLEIGVGTGRIALPLRRRGVRLAGMDISGAMLRRLVANAGEASPMPLLRADAARLPLAAGSFGSVLAVHVLHLIPDWRVAVDDALRVLRPGGTLIASFPGDGRPARLPRDATEGAPWAGEVRAALRRHGIVRPPVGARDPGQVTGYLGGRAAAGDGDGHGDPDARAGRGQHRAAALLLDVAVRPGAGPRRRRRPQGLGGAGELPAGRRAPRRFGDPVVGVRPDLVSRPAPSPAGPACIARYCRRRGRAPRPR